MRPGRGKCLLFILLLPALGRAEPAAPEPHVEAEQNKPKIYHTPRERRDAGLETPLTDWLVFSGLAEFELTSTQDRYRDPASNGRSSDVSSAVQLGFKLAFSDYAEGELALEFTDEKMDSVVDEAFVEFKAGDWSLTGGRQVLPFGAYYSYFVNGPLVEFTETKSSALSISYEYNELLEVAAFGFPGTKDARSQDDTIAWGVAAETALFKRKLVLGGGYIFDLADVDPDIGGTADGGPRSRVGAWNAYSALRLQAWELTLEAVETTRPFQGGTAESGAWNVELAYVPAGNWQLAARLERSRALSGEAARSYGVSATWLPNPIFSISIEYLRAEYGAESVFDEAGNERLERDIFTGRLSLEL